MYISYLGHGTVSRLKKYYLKVTVINKLSVSSEVVIEKTNGMKNILELKPLGEKLLQFKQTVRTLPYLKVRIF